MRCRQTSYYADDKNIYEILPTEQQNGSKLYIKWYISLQNTMDQYISLSRYFPLQNLRNRHAYVYL